jgi:hypothetical protein
MDEKAINLELRLLVIETMLAQLYKMFFAGIGATPRTIENKLERFEKELQSETFSGLDPAQSDLDAAERQHAFEHLLGMIRDTVGIAKKSKD